MVTTEKEDKVLKYLRNPLYIAYYLNCLASKKTLLEECNNRHLDVSTK